MNDALSQIIDATISQGTPAPAPRDRSAPFAGSSDGSRGNNDGTASRQWATRPDDERFTSMAALLKAAQDRRDACAESVVNLADINPVGNGRLMLDIAGKLLQPSHHGFSQYCNLVEAPADYLRRLPNQLAAECLGHGRIAIDRDRKVGVLSQGDRLRALTGAKYGRIWDAEVAEAVSIATQESGDRWEVPVAFRTPDMAHNAVVEPSKDDTTLYTGDRDMFIFLVDQRNPIEVGKLADGSPDLYFRGFYGWNSEVGARTQGFATFLYRMVCCNRIIWDQGALQRMKIRHTAGGPGRFVREMVPALRAFVDGSAAGIVDGITAARQIKVADDEDQALSFLSTYEFGERESRLILDRIIAEEGHPASSVMDFVQGITAHARSIEHQDRRVQMEQIGAQLLAGAIGAVA